MGVIKKINNLVIGLGRALASFVYPPYCILCESRLQPSDNSVCTQCWGNLPKAQPQCVESIVQHTSLIQQQYFDLCLSVWRYSQAAQEIIHLLKYNDYRKLAKNLGQAMGSLASEIDEYAKADYIIPVPLHPVKYREREFNQSVLLSEYVSYLINVPINAKILIRKRNTKPQALLNAEQRHTNVLDAFKVTKGVSVAGANIIIVDDVITTGSTINECSRILKKAGAHCIYVLTAFRA